VVLLDTGAGCNVISREALSKLPMLPDLKKSRLGGVNGIEEQSVLLNGHLLKLVINPNTSFELVCANETFMVVDQQKGDELFDIIVGNKTLHRYNVRPDSWTNKATYRPFVDQQDNTTEATFRMAGFPEVAPKQLF